MSSRLERLAAAIIRRHRSDFVADFGTDMLETFRARAARAEARGPAAYRLFAARELMGLAAGLVLERLRLLNLAGQQQKEEVRHAARRLRRTPGFTLAAFLTLGLAIGTTTAVFTLVHRIVIAPLPFPDAERLVMLDHAAPGLGLAGGVGMSVGMYREYKKLPSIDALALYAVREGTLSGDGEAVRAEFLQATPSLGGLVGMRPSLGRWFTESEGVDGAPHVVVLTDGMWRRRFGASIDAVGRTLQVDGIAYEVIGVLAPGAAFPDPQVQFVVPLPLPEVWTRAVGFNYTGIARLAPGVEVARARLEQNAVIADLPSRYPSDPEVAATVGAARLASLASPLKNAIVGDTAATLWVLLGAAGVVLLIACANLANLVLVRADARRGEVATRRALGASRAAVARTLLTETVLLGVTGGGGLGLLVGFVAIAAVVQGAPVEMPRLHEVRFDGVAAAFAIVLSLIAGLVLGAIPLLRQPRDSTSALLASERGATAGASRMWHRHMLMGAQVSLAVLLLSAGGLMVRSFVNLLRVDPGFEADSRLVFQVGLPRVEYPTRPDAAAFHAAMLDQIREMPGVARVAVTSTLPLGGPGIGDPLAVRGQPAALAEAPIVRSRRVSKEYFAAIGIPLRSGRPFDAVDEAGTTSSVIVNEALARLYFGGEDPTGRQIRPIEGDRLDRWLTIVGVVGNTPTDSLHESASVPAMYVPLKGAMWADVPAPHNVWYVVQTVGSPTAQIPAIRTVLGRLNPQVALNRPEPLTNAITRARAGRAFVMVLLVSAATVALVVGLIGVYAVIAYSVSRRRAEIGLRLAIGATPADVTRMILRESGRVIIIGVAIGVIGALATSRLMGALLFGVAPGDVATHATVGVALFVVAMIASWWPARLAAHLSPIESLRQG